MLGRRGGLWWNAAMKRVLVVGALLVPSLASAHIHLTFPTSRTALATGDQKEQHCGTVGYNRAADPSKISTFLPGQTITVTWDETIQHPGWFRIAFQPNGEVFGIPPASNGPTGGGAASNFPTANQEGVDPANSSIVLADRIPDGTTSMSITLPNMECSNCTLQFIQVMTDKAPYTVDTLSDDIYFNCADLVLAANAPDAGPGATVDAGVTGDAPAGGGGTDAVEGGCAVRGGSSGGGAGVALGLALVGVRRRRRAVR